MNLPSLGAQDGRWTLTWQPDLQELLDAAAAVSPTDYVSPELQAQLDRLDAAVARLKGDTAP